jgi:hypothetical protein
MDHLEMRGVPPQGLHHRFLHVAVQKEFQRGAFRFPLDFSSAAG